MLFIANTKIPENKSIFFSLKYLYGIGNYQSIFICKQLGFSQNLKTNELTNKQIMNLISFLNSLDLKLTDELKSFKTRIIQQLVTIKTYRGLRMVRGLPVRGQRTKTNSRTSRRLKKF